MCITSKEVRTNATKRLSDLRPAIEYKMRYVARPLTKGEIKRAADRAEACAKQMSQTIEDQSRSTLSKVIWSASQNDHPVGEI